MPTIITCRQPLAVDQQQPRLEASGAGSRRRQGARASAGRKIWCRSGPDVGAVEKEFRGRVSQQGSA
eukprot:6139-Pelagomonas_calceolata.AAC.3